MLVTQGLGIPVGGSAIATTRIVESIQGVANVAPKAGLVPTGLVGVVSAQKIKGIISKDDMAKITGKPIMGTLL